MQLVNLPHAYRPGYLPADQARTVASGFLALDAELPCGGWPTAGLLELVTQQNRALALQLLLPTLAHLTQQDDRWVALVAPPFALSQHGLQAAGIDVSRLLLVYPDAMHGIETIEQALANGNCSAVLAWPMVEDPAIWQRLSQAAELGGSLAVMFRESGRRIRQMAANSIRVVLHPADDSLLLDIQYADLRTRKRACQISYAQLYQLPHNVRLNS